MQFFEYVYVCVFEGYMCNLVRWMYLNSHVCKHMHVNVCLSVYVFAIRNQMYGTQKKIQ